MNYIFSLETFVASCNRQLKFGAEMQTVLAEPTTRRRELRMWRRGLPSGSLPRPSGQGVVFMCTGTTFSCESCVQKYVLKLNF